MNEIPISSNESGSPFVTTKEKLFDPSDPFRHATVFLEILRTHYSEYGVSLSAEILLIYSDGGVDHNITRISTQVSLQCLFIQLIKHRQDYRFKMRPTQSWVNPAERIMSILNPGLQICSLEREEMGENFEIAMKGVNSMNHLRNLCKRIEGLKESFQESVKPVKEIVNSIFENMALKDNKVLILFI